MKRILPFIIIIFLNVMSTSHAQWIQQPVPNNAGIMLSIDFANTNTGISGGNLSLFYGKALQTSNGGSNWDFATVPDSSRSFVSVDMVDSLTGYMAGAYNLFSEQKCNLPLAALLKKGYTHSMIEHMEKIGLSGSVDYKALFVKTTDGGRSWFTYGSLPSHLTYLERMDFIDANTGVITASAQDSTYAMNPSILKTTNGGLSWNTILNIDTVLRLNAIEFIDNDNIFAVGYGYRSDTSGYINTGGMIFYTTNGGTSWSQQFFPHKEFTDIFFTDHTNGFAVTAEQYSSVYKTTNQGINWQVAYTLPDNTGINGICFFKGSGTGMIYGISNFVTYTKRTTDYGETWGSMHIIDTTGLVSLYGGKMLSEFNNYISGGNPFGTGAIFHTTNGGITDVKILGNSLPEKYSLSQNYPNPFNPKTIISYQLSMFNYVSLKIYDVLGNEVSTLVNEKQSGGTYQVEFDGNGLSSGVYFYKIEAGDPSTSSGQGFVETKRMMLVK